MNWEPEHMISKGLVDLIEKALEHNLNWMAYNKMSFFMGKDDAFFFKNKEAAEAFSWRNMCDYSDFTVIPIRSVDQAVRLILNPDTAHQFSATAASNEITNSSSLKNTTTMNDKNLEYLVNQLKFAGFGVEKETELKEKIRMNQPEFSMVHHVSFGKDLATAQLHFRKSTESDKYFFNNYQLTVRNEEGAEKVKHTFYINSKENNITLKEAYNLLSGRSVHKELANKEGEKYRAWLQMDFKEVDTNGNYRMKQFHQNYGFDLEKSVASLPLKELGNVQEREKLIKSLERGNRQLVTLEHNGKQHNLFIEASPQFKSLNVYDLSARRINVRYLLEQASEKKGAVQAKKEGHQQGVDGEDAPGATQKKGKGKKQSHH